MRDDQVAHLVGPLEEDQDIDREPQDEVQLDVVPDVAVDEEDSGNQELAGEGQVSRPAPLL